MSVDELVISEELIADIFCLGGGAWMETTTLLCGPQKLAWKNKIGRL